MINTFKIKAAKMNTKELKSVLSNPGVFKKALLEDLETRLKESDIIKGEIKMARRYGKVNSLNSYIKRIINEADETDVQEEDEIEGSTDDVRESFRKVRRALREAEEELEVAEDEGQDVSDVKDAVADAQDAVAEGDEDEVVESLKKIFRKLKEAEEALGNTDVEEDDEVVVESLKKVSRKLSKAKRIVEETEVDDTEVAEDDEEPVAESRRRRALRGRRLAESRRLSSRRRLHESEPGDPDPTEEIEGSTDDVTESIKRARRALKEAEQECINCDEDDVEEVQESFRKAIRCTRKAKRLIEDAEENAEETAVQESLRRAKRLIEDAENQDVDANDECDVQEACKKFTSNIRKARKLVEDAETGAGDAGDVGEEDTDELTESFRRRLRRSY